MQHPFQKFLFIVHRHFENEAAVLLILHPRVHEQFFFLDVAGDFRVETDFEGDVFVPAIDGPRILQILLDVEIAFVENFSRNVHFLKTADPKRANVLLQVTVADQVKTLFAWNEIIGIDFPLRRFVPVLGVVHGVNRFMLENRLDDRLQEIRTLFAVGGRTHLDDAGDILDDLVLLRLFFAMDAHDLVVSRIETGRELVLVQHGGQQGEYERFLLGKVQRVEKELAHKPVAGASAFIGNGGDEAEDFQIPIDGADIDVAFQSQIRRRDAGIRLDGVDDVEDPNHFVDHEPNLA